MIYLASPYSDPDPRVREQRFQAVCQATAALLRSGAVVFSPIVHGHPLVAFGVPTDWSFWAKLDHELLRRCDEVVVLTLDGWRGSKGVQHELKLASALGKPIRYLDPQTGHASSTLAAVATGR